ncbi:MAG TPA: hypothetical protein VGI00_06960 [Streptosporangiaceae bacterium]
MTSRTSISLWSAAGLAVTAVALAGCAGSSNTDRPAAAVSSAPRATAGSGTGAGAGAGSASPLPRATTQGQCQGRPDSSGDILVRITTNGQPAATQQLGGAWSWDTKTSTCQTAVDAVIAAASASAGNCTQVAYSASNLGYKLNVSPAPALKKVLASKGPAC